MSIEECRKVLRVDDGYIHTLLIDSSEGEGEPGNLREKGQRVAEFRTMFPHLPLGVAGGLAISPFADTAQNRLLIAY